MFMHAYPYMPDICRLRRSSRIDRVAGGRGGMRPGRWPDFGWGLVRRVYGEEMTGAELFDEARRLGLMETRDREQGGSEIGSHPTELRRMLRGGHAGKGGLLPAWIGGVEDAAVFMVTETGRSVANGQ